MPEGVRVVNSHLNPVLARILYQRGLTTEQEIERFLFPDFSHQHDPYLLQGMASAVARLRLASESQEKVMIHGDYDADGITAAALMFKALSSMGIRAYVYIPSREDGYGLQREGLMLAKEKGCTLVVTVDCGVTAVKEAEEALTLGLDLIITDHHMPGGTVPHAAAVINPRLSTCAYPFKELAGVGVAYKVAVALLGETARDFLDLVALGTVADVAPLVGENRLYVQKGLEILKSPSPGLSALMQVAGVKPEGIRAGHIGFALAPRLNAAGRIGDASLPLRLLLTHSQAKALAIAEELDALNRERQRIEQDVLTEALALVNPNERAVVLSAPMWPHGVVGIVASRLVEKFYRPCILLCQGEQGEWRGSGRSIPGFDLVAALSRCSTTLVKYGGHRLAAGLTLKEEQLTDFRHAFLAVADEMPDALFTPRISIDAEIDVAEASTELAAAVELLAPFGIGNPEPVFASRQLTLTDKRLVGKAGEHLRIMWASAQGVTGAGIMFRAAERFGDLAAGDRLDITFRLSREEFRGQVQVSFQLRDFKVGAEWWLVMSPVLADARFARLTPELKAAFFQPPHLFTPMYLRRKGARFELRPELTLDAADTCILAAPPIGAETPPLGAACSFVDQDVMYSGKEQLPMLVPDRRALLAMYRFAANRLSFSLTDFAAEFSLPLAVAYSVAAAALSVFAELGLLEFSFKGGLVRCVVKSLAKQDLSQSATFVALAAWSKQGG
ncbi:MAG: Single-stranded-DNA-specific exonuclease RecJ [Firmicutes bacterium]|nr:Single-stranded-DNA-specific exonuclease RecJ [candidate division NPL-UPA2 bacterium]